MDDLKFNIYAFANPTTEAEYIALLDEAIRMIVDLEDDWNNIFLNKW